jgi:uncharacterized membrane protein YjjB (DUF3815 family)
MTTLEALERWRLEGAITGEQYQSLAAIVRKDRFSVFLELNALLYLGVLAFVAGLGWTVREHFSQLGDAAIVIPLAAVFGACLYYCFSRARPYDPARVESPNFAFDYVLYLGCLVFGIELGFIEFRFQLLRGNWDLYLLASAVLYFVLAYRFDNRFVLSLALSTLAGWFGVRFTTLGFHIAGSLRGDALAYAGLTAVAGWWTRRADVKPHFLDTYLHVAVNAALGALLSGVLASQDRALWFIALLAASAVVIERGVKARRFVFVVYGVVYGYVGLSAQFLRRVNDATTGFAYFIVSGAAVLIALVVLSRRFGRED